MKPRRAFTLIEMLITIIIVAILSITLALSFSGVREKATFQDNELKIVDMLQTARGYSLSNILVNSGEPTAYYTLEFTTNAINLYAVGTAGSFNQLDVLELDAGFMLDREFKVYYFPPYGEICFSDTCDTGTTSQTFNLKTTRLDDAGNPTHKTTIEIPKYGGYPNITDSY